MKVRTLAAALAGCASLAACEQASQKLPFDSDTDQPIVRQVPAEGGTVSSSAGASVQIPAGALPSGATITLTPVASSASESGGAAAAYAFRLSPDGLSLAKPAGVDLSVDRTSPSAWLASVVVTNAAGVTEVGTGSVDLSSGIAHGDISSLGTVTATIPEPGAVLRAGILSSATASLSPAPRADVAAAVSTPTRSLRGDCGAARNRCGTLTVEVSPNLRDLVDTLAVVYPRVAGEIRITGATAAGQLSLDAPLRVRVGGGKNAVAVPGRITAIPTAATVVTETAGRITLTNVTVRGESGQHVGETTTTLVVEYQGEQAFIRMRQSFDAVLGQDRREPVTVAARIPLHRVF
jgi:hypothetical protein